MSCRILLVDNDHIKQQAIIDSVMSNSKISIVSVVKKGTKALELIRTLKPKVVVIGDHLADMSGYDFVVKLMKRNPIPVLIIIDEDKENPIDYPEALDYGIVDSISVSIRENKITFPRLVSIRLNVLNKLNVKRFHVQIEKINKYNIRSVDTEKDNSDKLTIMSAINNRLTSEKKPQVVEKTLSITPKKFSNKIIVMGASTGGPKMLIYIISQFPANFLPVLVVQHMPKGFIQGFAKRMNDNARMFVKKAEDGDVIRDGNVYIAPGGYHMELDRGLSGIRIKITEGPKVNFIRPAVDVTLFSAAKEYGSQAIGVILSGMGSDGREGCRALKSTGGTVITLNEKDSVIYGMNRAVIDAGLADVILGMEDIVNAIDFSIQKKKVNS